MISKTCPHCGGTSFSAGAVPWICPYCGKTIEEEKETNEGSEVMPSDIY